MLEQLKVDNTEEKDTLGGGNGPLDTEAYLMKIEAAYLGKAASGAINLNLRMVGQDNISHRETIYVTNKAGSPYYEDRKTGEKRVLPGMMTANSLVSAALQSDQQLGDLTTEEKVINVYDYTASKEVPTKVNMLMDLVNTQVVIGVQKAIVDKNEKNSAGDYVPSGDTREETTIRKCFDANGFTKTERKQGLAEPVFIHNWREKYAGTVQEKAKGVRDPSLGTAGASAAATAPATAPVKPLFS